MNPLRSRIAEGKPTRAMWLEAASPVLAEAAVYAGMRFLLIDNEHGSASIETTAHMMRAIEAAGGHPMVRVAANDPVLLKRVLEIGATSIMVPLVNTAEEARAAVAACRYPPAGARGFAGDIRASRYGTDTGHSARANDDLFLMLQIESAEGVENVAGIAAVDGVDMIFIGPYDMSGSYGKPGETDCSEVQAAIERIVAVADNAGRPVGTVTRAGKDVRTLLEGPFALVIADSEIGLVVEGVRQELSRGEPDWT